jgi:hypothetical protein
MVAHDGWRLLGDYRFDTTTGLWRHRRGLVEPPVSLRAISYEGGVATMPSERMSGGEDLLAEQLLDAASILAAAPGPDLQQHPGHVSADFEHLRWFDLPSCCLEP